MDEIKTEVSEAEFYGHMVDETTDVSTKNQMSVIVRFVHKGEVKERFLGFTNVSDLSGDKPYSAHCTCVVHPLSFLEYMIHFPSLNVIAKADSNRSHVASLLGAQEKIRKNPHKKMELDVLTITPDIAQNTI